jgi:3-hydroxyacyl-[acyl-carrier-protein] dehydratase
MLLIDRVLECEPGKRIKAIKNVTINEPFFPGHYPHWPVMPGVLIIEALAQTAAVLSFATMGKKTDDRSIYYFAGIDGARFKRPIIPGDQMVMEVEIVRMSRGVGKYKARASVDGALAAEAELLCTYRALAAAPSAESGEPSPALSAEG